MTGLNHNNLKRDEVLTELILAKELSGRPLFWYDEVDSTNNIALKMAGEGAASGTIILADSQTSGRGRLNRNWVSPSGRNIYFSIILKPNLSLEIYPKITMAVGVGVCRSLAKTTRLKPQLKWPNDIFLGNRKLAGILTESGPLQKGSIPWVVVGVGVNILITSAEFSTELREKATSLLIHCGKSFSRGEILLQVVGEIKKAVKELQDNGFESLLADWQKLDATKGKHLSWSCSEKEIHGISLGPDKDGFLRLLDDSGKEHQVVSGTILINDH
jgi:BirA family transcriptional regulator, biotin operon repressor / biotin---[acetyl-CoA-carboxylase] ligase